MAKVRQFEDLEAWKIARVLAKAVYRISSNGEFATDFNLRNQLRRSAISALSNIAEGFERDGNREFLHFLAMAKGSCGEVRSQLFAVPDLAYITDDEFQSLYKTAVQLSRLLSGLMNHLRQSQLCGRKYK